MLDPLIIKAISIGLGLMFLIAAYHKLANAAGFRMTLLEYQLLPESWVPVFSRVVPLIELLLGGSWLFYFYKDTLTAVASATLLGLYTLAIGINLARGRVHIDCGCGFGGKSDAEQFLSGGLVARNVVLIGLALFVLLPAADRSLTAVDYIMLVATLTASTFMFAATNRLIANRASINTWRKGGD